MAYEFKRISVDFLERKDSNGTITKYTYGEMFFKPYEDKWQFAHHTRQVGSGAISSTLIGVVPFIMLGVVGAYVAFSLSAYSFSSINEKVGGDEKQSKTAHTIASAAMFLLLQAVVDALLLSIATLTLLTRGISTGLKAAGIYDYDAITVKADSNIPTNIADDLFIQIGAAAPFA